MAARSLSAHDDGIPADGRAARGYRARIAVAAALLDLLNQAVVRPTAAEIAKHANVSLRLVFHHFKDVEAIYADAADLQFERLRPLIRPVSPSLPIGRRIEEFVRVRSDLHEAVTPVRRASMRLEPFSRVIKSRLSEVRAMTRAETRRVFDKELAATSRSSRRDTASALEAITAWETWEVMRAQQGLSALQARRAIARAISVLLGAK